MELDDDDDIDINSPNRGAPLFSPLSGASFCSHSLPPLISTMLCKVMLLKNVYFISLSTTPAQNRIQLFSSFFFVLAPCFHNKLFIDFCFINFSPYQVCFSLSSCYAFFLSFFVDEISRKKVGAFEKNSKMCIFFSPLPLNNETWQHSFKAFNFVLCVLQSVFCAIFFRLYCSNIFSPFVPFSS